MIKKAFIWAWCLPQMLAGLVVKIVTKAKKAGDHYEYRVQRGSVSLGTYVFICPNHIGDDTVLLHEKGHSRQSLYLGWMYPFVIGIPSLMWACAFGRIKKRHNIDYYEFYTEKWADKLAGIDRGARVEKH